MKLRGIHYQNSILDISYNSSIVDFTLVHSANPASIYILRDLITGKVRQLSGTVSMDSSHLFTIEQRTQSVFRRSWISLNYWSVSKFLEEILLQAHTSETFNCHKGPTGKLMKQFIECFIKEVALKAHVHICMNYKSQPKRPDPRIKVQVLSTTKYLFGKSFLIFLNMTNWASASVKFFV